jgi:DNA-binding XRE family transcriptional regulator
VDDDYILRPPEWTVPLPKFDDLGRGHLADARQGHQLISRRRVEVYASSIVAYRRSTRVCGSVGGGGILSRAGSVSSARKDRRNSERGNSGSKAPFDYRLHSISADGFCITIWLPALEIPWALWLLSEKRAPRADELIHNMACGGSRSTAGSKNKLGPKGDSEALRKVEGHRRLKEYRPAKKRISVSVGESVRIIRELQELSQNQLAQLTGIPKATISAIENDRVRLGVERAKILSRALKCHPGILVFPGWELPDDAAA